jgi:hypothetical protein
MLTVSFFFFFPGSVWRAKPLSVSWQTLGSTFFIVGVASWEQPLCTNDVCMHVFVRRGQWRAALGLHRLLNPWPGTHCPTPQSGFQHWPRLLAGDWSIAAARASVGGLEPLDGVLFSRPLYLLRVCPGHNPEWAGGLAHPKRKTPRKPKKKIMGTGRDARYLALWDMCGDADHDDGDQGPGMNGSGCIRWKTANALFFFLCFFLFSSLLPFSSLMFFSLYKHQHRAP